MADINIQVILRGTQVQSYIVDIPNLDRYEQSLQTTYIAGVVAKDMILENIIPFTKSGQLLKSFKVKKSGPRKSTVYSDLVYSRAQDLGAKIRITDRMRRMMWYLYKKTRKSVYKAIALTKQDFVILPAKDYTKIDKSELKKRIIKEFNG